jgi:hypothetical protein
LLVKLVGITYEVPPVKDLEKKDKKLLVKLQVENKGSAKVDFQGWGTPEDINKTNPPTLTDAAGDAHDRVTFGAGVFAEGMVLAETIQPGKSVQDLIVFDPPPSGTPYVKLELSAENFNEKGKFIFLVPNAVLAKAGPLPKGPDKEVKKPDMKPDGKPDAKPEPKPEKPEEKPMKEPAAVAILKPQLKSKLAPSRLEAVNGLMELGAAAASAAKDVAELLKDPKEDEQVRVAAAECLAKFGAKGKDAIPALIEAVKKDEFWKVRAEAARALGKMGPTAEPALAPLAIAMTKEKDEMALAAIKEAIKKIDKDAKVDEKDKDKDKDKE